VGPNYGAIMHQIRTPYTGTAHCSAKMHPNSSVIAIKPMRWNA
jgi:hypothetical protein